MDKQINMLREILGSKKYNKSYKEFEKGVLLFKSQNGLQIPNDLNEYFELLENAVHELDKDLYQFYPFKEFKSVASSLSLFKGVPDYSNIVKTLSNPENCFVFADYMSHLFAYAIRLNSNATDFNEVYLICGDKYKLVANSFSDFLKLYFDNSLELKTI